MMNVETKTYRLILCMAAWLLSMKAGAMHWHWTVADGLPTGEVRQIVELPNGQMLVNCEGVFCLANGAGFDVIGCDYRRTYQLPTHAKGYGQLWQDDSLLWLHDFYRLFLFDARRRAFRYDISREQATTVMQCFTKGELLRPVPNDAQWRCVDSLGLAHNYSTLATDRQGGLWIGTRNDGIVYLSPRRPQVDKIEAGHPLIDLARSYTDSKGSIWRCRGVGVEREQKGTYTLYDKSKVRGLPYNRTSFIQQLADGRYLLCDSLSTLGYLLPERHEFRPLNDKLPGLQGYRRFVGACPTGGQWMVVYTQNGAFMLDTKADTMAAFAPADNISQYATKYNCMLRDRKGHLWIGTQNGLFEAIRQPQQKKGGPEWTVRKTEGLRNTCIRSLVMDGEGHVWAGTSCGIARITPTVVNLGREDGVPPLATMERAACLTDDGRLVFAIDGGQALAFRPGQLIADTKPHPVVITSLRVNGEERLSNHLSLNHRENHIAISFSTLDYATPSHNNYRYRLWPTQQQWNMSSDGSGQATATYTALPPGSYRFEVQASTLGTGAWGGSTITEIEIRPPLWLTWWAKTLYVLLTLGVATLLIHLYLKKRRLQIERKNEERVNQLFELRDAARHQFARSVNIEPEKITANKEEEKLVEKMMKAIAQHMDDIDYTIDQLASDVGMSRASLYKKMQQMLGITPNDFLRNVRLKHAARLLAETSYPVNQVSLMVGFQTSRYFSQCFRQLFGVTPTEYRQGRINK